MKPVHITDETFDQEVLKSDKLTIVDFWAEWCGPCKMIAPVLEELANEHEQNLKITKLDVDANPQKSMAFGVRSIPTLLFFKDGKVVNQVIGAVPKRTLEAHISQLLEHAA